MYHQLIFHCSLDVALWAAFTVVFSFLRKSNLFFKFADSKSGHAILWKHAVTMDKFLLRQIISLKTKQFQQRNVINPLASIPQSIFCLVKAYHMLQECVVISDDSSAFSHKNVKNGAVPLTYNLFESQLQTLLYQIGLDPSSYSCHSFRRSGRSFEFIKNQGDWASDAYKHYPR